MNKNALLEKHILKLENDLLKAEVRTSIEKTCELLVDGFIEFCSSGHIYILQKGESINDEFNDDLQELNWEITDFRITNQLSDDCLLATFKLIKHNESDENKKYSLRSSIWKSFNGQWKMVFHQGTLVPQV